MYVNQGYLPDLHGDGRETHHWRNGEISFFFVQPPPQLNKTSWMSYFCWFFKDIQSLNVDVTVELGLDYVSPPTLVAKNQ